MTKNPTWWKKVAKMEFAYRMLVFTFQIDSAFTVSLLLLSAFDRNRNNSRETSCPHKFERKATFCMFQWNICGRNCKNLFGLMIQAMSEMRQRIHWKPNLVHSISPTASSVLNAGKIRPKLWNCCKVLLFIVRWRWDNETTSIRKFVNTFANFGLNSNAINIR